MITVSSVVSAVIDLSMHNAVSCTQLKVGLMKGSAAPAAAVPAAGAAPAGGLTERKKSECDTLCTRILTLSVLE